MPKRNTEKKRQEAPEPEPAVTDECRVIILGGEIAEYECGHHAATAYGHDLYGQTYEMSEEFLARREMCNQCALDHIKAQSARCAKCGHIILPGEVVALYDASDAFPAKWSTVAGRDGKRVIGCMRDGCCESGGFYAGRWTAMGFMPAFDGRTQAEYVIATGLPVVTDLS